MEEEALKKGVDENSDKMSSSEIGCLFCVLRSGMSTHSEFSLDFRQVRFDRPGVELELTRIETD